MDDAGAQVMDLMCGRWRSQILYAGGKPGVCDALAAGHMAAADMAGELGLGPGLCLPACYAPSTLWIMDERLLYA